MVKPGEESATYVNLERGREIYSSSFRRALEYVYACKLPGSFAEFGSYRGFTAKIIAELMVELEVEFEEPSSDRKLYLYDSFEGFPPVSSPIDLDSYELRDSKQWLPGTESAGADMPAAIDKCMRDTLNTSVRHKITQGFYDSLSISDYPKEKLAMVHLDCDLYESTLSVVSALLEADCLQDGLVFMCDDYNCNRASPVMGQRRVFSELFREGNRYHVSEFFSYGWHGKAFFLHDSHVTV